MGNTKDSSSISKSNSPYLITSSSSNSQNNSTKSSNFIKSNNFNPNTIHKKPHLATFASIKDNKTQGKVGDNIFPKTGIIIVEDDTNASKSLQREVKPIRPFEEESTSSDSSTSSTEEGFATEDIIHSHNSISPAQTTWLNTVKPDTNTLIQNNDSDRNHIGSIR